MHSNQVGLEVKYLVGAIFYIYALYMRAAKALARLHICAVLPEPWLLAYDS